MFSAILSLLSFLGPVAKFAKANAKVVIPIVLIAAAVGAYYWHDSRQSARIEQLEIKYRAVTDTLRAERTLAAALKDTLRNIAENKPLPEIIQVDYPVPGPNDTSNFDTDLPVTGKPYVSFNDQQHWENWFRQHCAGVINIDTSAIWENGQGAHVQGELYYGEGVNINQYSWLLITPAGKVERSPVAAKCPQRLVGLTYSTHEELSGVMGLVYLGGWIASIGVDYDLPKNQIGASIGIIRLY